ncbi:DUF1579 domain-containing protein [Chitinophaga sp. XS-30]|uniref:DUF1579 domain-containing protein n=1 Tax=Chitinophaga sp. XS-30 TaxID=2604421 RepID=UPI0011DD04A9|nr:DUF1579 domain-containing protein [Chitinophaga sp. XS-30]QEH43410.1 DUF1579 domain-containing protein [Chitinophaga sp. XS-30]
MKHTLFFLISILCSSTAVLAQDEAAEKAWMDYMTPGSMHKMLALGDGEWKSEMKFWMAPGAPPSTQSGTCTNKMILGGRYQESRHVSSFAGQPFEGISTLGYDNAKKVFQSTWVDNMGSGIMFLEGKWDDATRSITFTGKTTDPVSGKEQLVREVFKWVDDNTQFMEMYMMTDGTEFKSMEMTLTRK